MTLPMRHRFLKYSTASMAALVIAELFLSPYKVANASFGAEIPILIKILAETIQQVRSLQMIIGTTRETAGVLADMNRGVKDVLRLANTAHVPLPPQVFEAAKTLEQATNEVNRIYGSMPGGAPIAAQRGYQSGTESLYLSQDAFEYSTFLDDKGERIKGSAVLANQASATRLTAESMGVLIHAVSHTNRIEAKSLEILATERLEASSKENAKFESFLTTHADIEKDFRLAPGGELNSFSDQNSTQGSFDGPSSVRVP